MTAPSLAPHQHECEQCGDFNCTRPGCPLGRVITHKGHERELERREARGFTGPDGQPA